MRPSLRSRRVGSLVPISDFGQHDPDRSALLVDHLAVPDLVLDLAQRVRARGRATDAQFRLLGHLDLGEEAARGRVPAGEVDAGCLADQAASSVAPDEIPRAKRPAVGQRDVHAGVVLREAGHLGAVVDRHLQLADPAREDALDVLLPQPEPVGMAGGEVADVQASPAEPRDLGDLPLGQESIRDPALIEDLDRARLQTAGARSGEGLARTALDDDDVDARQGQLARQHQPGRASAGDHHCVFGHGNSRLSG